MPDDPVNPGDIDPVEEDVSRHDPSEMPTLDPSSMPPKSGDATAERKAVADRAKVPDRIGPYVIKSLIGSGGMGSVYEAIQEDPQRRVALKVIKPGCVSEQAMQRFRFEAQVLGRLRHPGIAQIYEAGTFEDEYGERPYYAMEFIPGAKSLTEYATTNNLSLEDRLDLFERVCEAVHHGHQKGIIHRDLKPDNILIDATGNPKIIDFGVARTTDADVAVKTMQTTFGQILGTLQYMSPEQVQGDPSDLDTRSDVYALGIILYELLCEQLPYDVKAKALHEAVRVIQESPPQRPSTITRVIRGDIETITLKALEKTRDRRYESASAFGRDIRRFLDSEPIEARRASMVYQLRMFSKRHQFTVASAAAVVLAITLGLVMFGLAWARAERLNVALEAANAQVEIERDVAITQRTLAEDRLDKNKALYRDRLGETVIAIRRLDGALEEKHRLAKSVLDYFESLDEGERTPEDIATLADAHTKLAEMLGGSWSHSVNDSEGAMVHLLKANKLWSQAADNTPGDPAPRIMEAITLRRMGLLHRGAGKQIEAMGSFESSANILRPLLEKMDPSVNSYIGAVRTLSLVYTGMGDTRQDLDDMTLAIESYERARVLLDAAVAAHPEHLNLQTDSGLTMRSIGYALMKIDPERGLDIQRRSHDIFERLAADHSTDGYLQRRYGWGLYFLGLAEAGFPDKRDDAIDHMGRGWKLVVVVCSKNPSSARSRKDVRDYMKNYYDQLVYLDARELIPGKCREAALVLQPVVEANPDNVAMDDLLKHVLEEMHTREAAASSTP